MLTTPPSDVPLPRWVDERPAPAELQELQRPVRLKTSLSPKVRKTFESMSP